MYFAMDIVSLGVDLSALWPRCWRHHELFPWESALILETDEREICLRRFHNNNYECLRVPAQNDI